jgi:hypothetical protein
VGVVVVVGACVEALVGVGGVGGDERCGQAVSVAAAATVSTAHHCEHSTAP